jgi:hypothetical protein
MVFHQDAVDEGYPEAVADEPTSEVVVVENVRVSQMEDAMKAEFEAALSSSSDRFRCHRRARLRPLLITKLYFRARKSRPKLACLSKLLKKRFSN